MHVGPRAAGVMPLPASGRTHPERPSGDLDLPLSTTLQALIHGLNRHYYSIAINYRKTALEENMLLNLQVNPRTALASRGEGLTRVERGMMGVAFPDIWNSGADRASPPQACRPPAELWCRSTPGPRA